MWRCNAESGLNSTLIRVFFVLIAVAVVVVFTLMPLMIHPTSQKPRSTVYVAVVVAFMLMPLMIHPTSQKPRSTVDAVMVAPVDDANLSNTETVELYQQRLLVCLDRANMTNYFTQEGLLDTALNNVKYTVNTIYQFIPTKFSKRFHCSCWKSDFGLTVENSTVQGHFGQFTFQGNTAVELLALQKFKFRVGGKYSAHFSCLPEVFLAGFPKCGSTFLHALLTSHPAVVEALVKEPRWWERAMSFNQSKVEVAVHLSNYLINFAPLVRRLNLAHKLHVLSVDATPSLMFDWPNFPNQDWRTNFCLLPTVLPSVVQNSKFIVVMRNPVSMLYSAFWHSCTRHKQTVPPDIKVRGPSIFHERIKTKVLDFNSCMEHFPLAKCVMDAKPELYTSELPHCGRTRLDVGVYFVHVQKWLSVVSKEKFLFLTLEELSSQTEKVAKQIWRFLNVSVSANTFQRAMHRYTWSMNVQHTVDYHHNPQLTMRDDTKELLLQFFKPYNKKLAELVGDQKFLW